MNDSLPKLPETPFKIKSSVINSPHKLPLAQARTEAALIAENEFLIYLDVDCIPYPDLVETFAHHLEQEDALYQGSIRYLNAQWSKEWTFETLYSDSAPNKLQGEELICFTALYSSGKGGVCRVVTNGVLILSDKIQDLRNCHNTWLVRDTENIVTTFTVAQSVTAPYKKNMPVAAIPKMIGK